MKKSLWVLLVLATLNVQSAQEAAPAAPLTCHELLFELETQTPHPAQTLIKPEVIAVVASGLLATTAVQPAVQRGSSSSFSLVNTLFFLGLGGGLTGLLVYGFIGEEVGAIVNFKSTIKKLLARIGEWQTIIDGMQEHQTSQEKKLQQAQAQLAKIFPLMQQLVKQSSNDQILGEAVSHLQEQCETMADRIKALEGLLMKVAELDNKHDESSTVARAKRIKRLIKKSQELFGKPIIAPKNHWWHLGKTPSAVV